MRLTQSIRWFFQSPTLTAQRTRSAVKLAIVIGLFVILFWIVPIEQVLQALLSADPRLLVVGMILGFVSTVLTAVEIRPLAKNQGLQHGVLSILAINLAVKFYNQFLPTSLVGSGIRWYRLSQPGNKVAESLATLAFFRAETFLTVVGWVSIFLRPGDLPDQHRLADRHDLGIIVGWISSPVQLADLSLVYIPHRPISRVCSVTKRVDKFFGGVRVADIGAGFSCGLGRCRIYVGRCRLGNCPGTIARHERQLCRNGLGAGCSATDNTASLYGG
jgi:hypothetical protein